MENIKEIQKISAGKRRNLCGIPRIIAFIIGFTLTVVTFYTAFKGVFLPIIQRSSHICLLIALIFLWYPANKESSKNKPMVIDFICTSFSLLIFFWTLYSHQRFLLRIPFYSEIHPIDIIAGCILVVLVLEAGRRTLGWFISVLSAIFIAYAFFGPYMPMMLAHPGFSLNKFIDQMYLTSEGIFGSLMGLSATLLFSFVAFGTFLQATNADKYYMNIALALTGKKPGGPAKVAILSSAAMGTISGSTIANVVTTGTLTIPLMKRTGYAPNEAAAIETVASAAGQIMPPIMGTGAFIMAEVLGVKYIEIVKVSLIPAIIFYASIWFLVDLKARKKKLSGLKEEKLPNLKDSVKKGLPLFIPIVILVVLLVKGFTPFLAGSLSTVLILLVTTLKKNMRLTIKKFMLALEKCAINMTSISGIIACAAIMVGIINKTGLTLKTTAIILHLSGGYLITTIALEAVLAYVLGMGLPIATSYILLSTLGAPALIELGVLPLAAHLMIFWFSQLATITPPVCMTAYAAAGIAGADPMKTGFTALKFGSPFYFIPMLFIFSNILHGNFFQASLIGFVVIIGIYFLAVSLESYFFVDLGYIKRIISFLIFIVIFASTFNIFMLKMRLLLFLVGLFIGFYLYFIQKKKL